MKQSEIKNLSVAELQRQLIQTKKIHGELKMAHANAPIQNPIEIRIVRRTVARLATELTKRGLQ